MELLPLEKPTCPWPWKSLACWLPVGTSLFWGPILLTTTQPGI